MKESPEGASPLCGVTPGSIRAGGWAAAKPS